MPIDPPPPSAPAAPTQGRLPGSVREVLLRRFRDPEEAAAIRRLGHLLLALVEEAGQPGSADSRRTIRPVLLAVARDLLVDASNLAEVAAEHRWNWQRSESEADLAGRVEAWAFQLQLIARSIRETLGVETGEPPVGPDGDPTGPSGPR